MEQGTIVQQMQFSSLEAFVAGMNNYYAHFLMDNSFGEIRREKPPFKRFQEQNPKMERDLTDKVTAVMAATRNKEDLPLELLFESYGIMSQLVYAGDPRVIKYSHPEMCLTS